MRSNGNYDRNDTELCYTRGANQVNDQRSDEAANTNHRSAIILWFFRRIFCSILS